ncbi:MAG TPA: hypothetical protein VK861_04435 [Bacteroidales bacterium]|nr:hypothetical protein [Bacteroidales bacterium]
MRHTQEEESDDFDIDLERLTRRMPKGREALKVTLFKDRVVKR